MFGLLVWTLITSVHTAATIPRDTGASESDVPNARLANLPSTDTRSENNLVLEGPIGGPNGEPWDDSINMNSVAPCVTVNFSPCNSQILPSPSTLRD